MSDLYAALLPAAEGHREPDLVVVTPGGADMPTLARLRDITATPRKTDPPGGVRFAATWPSLVQLTSEFGVEWHPMDGVMQLMTTEAARRTAIRPVEASGYLRSDAPTPREYQRYGAGVIAATGKGLIFDDPGTGKTLTAILGVLGCMDRGLLSPAAPVIVVCPNSVQDSWVDAWHTWTTLKAVAWRGTATVRRRISGSADVYVVGYATAANDADRDRPGDGAPLLDLRAGAVVIDECHWIKNPHAARSVSVRKMAARCGVVVALSGTPITHNALDLWPTLFATDPASWPSRERFLRRYLRTVPGDYEDVVVGLNREPEFRLVLTGQYRSLRKTDILTELPPKVYSVRQVPIPAAYRAQYDQMEADMIARLDSGEELPAPTVLAQLTRLSQMASAAADVGVETLGAIDEFTGRPKQAIHVHLKDPSWKVDVLMDILAERPDKQTLVFSPSAQLVRLAGARCERAGIATGYIIGGQSAADRTATVDQFQAGKLDVICATTQAGGVGLTLTAASTVVFLQRPWSYVEASQAEDRAHRIGSEQHESIEIIDIVAERTVESRVRTVLREKAGSLAELLQDPRIRQQVLGGLK